MLTPRGPSRFVDDSDDRLFRQVTDDQQSQRARSDRGVLSFNSLVEYLHGF